VIAGAGSIGCYIGGCLAAAGRDVTLLLRDRLASAIGLHGLNISDFGGEERHLSPSLVRLATEPAAAFRDARLVLVTVKCGDTAAIATSIAGHAPGDALVVSLQNGVGNVAALAGALGPKRVIAGCVTLNVVQASQKQGPPRFHSGTSGGVMVGPGPLGLATALDVPGLPASEPADITGTIWSKLVLNMNNALNAISGLPLVAELADPGWRRLLARHMDETLSVLADAGIATVAIEGVNPRLIPYALRLPTPLFRLVARGMMAIDREARSSMAQDILRGRPTEVDFLQGAVIDLARDVGRRAPIAERVRELVRRIEAEGPASAPVSPQSVLASLR
jgi:2-dehydropantoate 2-reductase